MNIAEARSYNNGIDFYVSKKNITISVRRNTNGDIIVEKHNTKNGLQKAKSSPLIRAVLLLLSILFALIIKNSISFKIEMLITLAFIWSCIILYYLVISKNSNNLNCFKYHAAEHKVLNYMDKYGKATQDYNEIAKMSSVSLRCGSTVIVVVCMLITLFVTGILFIPLIILKILWCIISAFITMYLWANGKCNFLQKLILQEPGPAEIEIAIRGLWEYVSMKE